MPGPITTVESNFPLILGFGLAVGAVTVGVWGAKGSRGLNGATVRRPPRGRGFGGPTEIRELQLFCENDGDLYRQQVQPIHKNLQKKLAKGSYDHEKSKKLWMYLADNCAKKYAKDFGSEGQPWHKLFSTSDRRAVAARVRRRLQAGARAPGTSRAHARRQVSLMAAKRKIQKGLATKILCVLKYVGRADEPYLAKRFGTHVTR